MRTTSLFTVIAMLVFGIVLACGTGCLPYRFGSSTMFPAGIRTVHVPVARNDTFRHDLGIRLTEAVCREIEDRTPYVVSGNPLADSTLQIRVLDTTKRVLTETDTDDPRALDTAVTVRATWVDRNGQTLLANSAVPSGDFAIGFAQTARLVPEAGDSISTATERAIETMAAQIVSQMESRW
ncbi:MAG: LPS assembly lipoprotein LptE [Planctomycetota bacterium]